VIYSYNKSQQHALFLKFILAKKFTCFGQAYSPTSELWILYSQQLVFVIQSGLELSSILTSLTDSQHNCMTNTSFREYSIKTPDDGQQICPKPVEFFTKIKLRNSTSCWLLLKEYMYIYIYIYIYIYTCHVFYQVTDTLLRTL